jgi:pimeloyl-ACP methyl ester carboxylesterase
MKTKYLQLDTVKVAYTEYGSGPNLILLHGNSQNKSIFRKHQLRYFKDFHTYALDSGGHGRSVSKNDEYSIKQYSEDIINFCKKLGIQKTSVIGFSDGGNICLFLAQKSPELFEKIIVLSPNYLAEGSTDSTLYFLNKMYTLFLFLNKIHFLPKRKVKIWELMLTDIGITEEELGAINAGIFMLYAENDMIKEEHILKMSGLIKNCKVKKIENSKHLNLYKKDETIKEILEYLKS